MFCGLTVSQSAHLDQLRKGRLSDPQEELSRLYKLFCEVVGEESPKRELEWKKTVQDLFFSQKIAFDLNPKVWPKAEVLYQQGLLIRKILESTHYVFLHAQQSQNKGEINRTTVTNFLREAEKQRGTSHKGFKPLRLPFKDEPTLDAFLSQTNPSEKMDYDHDPEIGKRLLSTDLFLQDSFNESVVEYLVLNSSVQKASAAKEICKEILLHYYPFLTSYEVDDMLEKIKEKLTSSDAPIGNLYVVCIPKDRVSKAAYLSHSFGIPCRCQAADESKFENRLFCNETERASQFRIFIPELDPSKGDLVFLLSPETKEVRKSQKQVVRDVLEKAGCISKDRNYLTYVLSEASQRITHFSISDITRRYFY